MKGEQRRDIPLMREVTSSRSPQSAACKRLRLCNGVAAILQQNR